MGEGGEVVWKCRWATEGEGGDGEARNQKAEVQDEIKKEEKDNRKAKVWRGEEEGGQRAGP